MIPTACRPWRSALGHDFDADSGWCVHGCGVRNDGRVIAVRDARPLVPGRAAPVPLPGAERAARPRVDYPDVTEPRRGQDRPW